MGSVGSSPASSSWSFQVIRSGHSVRLDSQASLEIDLDGLDPKRASERYGVLGSSPFVSMLCFIPVACSSAALGLWLAVAKA